MKLWEARTYLYLSVLATFLLIPAWLMETISDRHMIGVTLFLSLLALIIESRNGIRVAKENDD